MGALAGAIATGLTDPEAKQGTERLYQQLAITAGVPLRLSGGSGLLVTERSCTALARATHVSSLLLNGTSELHPTCAAIWPVVAGRQRIQVRESAAHAFA